jgi:hypothetical protein
MGVGKRICTPGAQKPPPTALPGAKKNETPKNAIKPFGAQWILDASGRRAAFQHRPTADSGPANGWRTVDGMWTDHVRSYTTPTLALGPRLRRVLAEGVLFTAKSGAQSIQALVTTDEKAMHTHGAYTDVLYHALAAEAAQPERQSDPAIYRKREKFSKILSRWLHLEFNSACNHRDQFLIFLKKYFHSKIQYVFRWTSRVNITGAQSKSSKILENPESLDRKFP